MHELQQTLQQLNKDFLLALQRGDLDKAAAMFAEGGIILPPGSAAVVNKRPLDISLKQLSQWNVELNTVDVRSVGSSVLREMGTIKLTRKAGMAPAPGARAAGPGVSVNGQYLAIWEEVGNEWKRNSLIWNRAAPAQAPGANPAMRQGRNMPGRPVYVPRTE